MRKNDALKIDVTRNTGYENAWDIEISHTPGRTKAITVTGEDLHQLAQKAQETYQEVMPEKLEE